MSTGSPDSVLAVRIDLNLFFLEILYLGSVHYLWEGEGDKWEGGKRSFTPLYRGVREALLWGRGGGRGKKSLMK